MISARDLKISAIEIEPFSLMSFIKEDMAFSYMRRAQNSGTLWNWSLAKRMKGQGKLFMLVLAMVVAPLRVPIWLRAIFKRYGGGSMWIELTRN
jgi:hypothetical protein